MKIVRINSMIKKGEVYGVMIVGNDHLVKNGHKNESYVESHHRTLNAAKRQAASRRSCWRHKVDFEVVILK